jgi:hypothetical protein
MSKLGKNGCIEKGDGADYSEGMSAQDAASFRLNADECREQSERATNLRDKEQWLRLSHEWTKMAQDVERRLRN